MKFQELTEKEKVNVKKHIKEELTVDQKVKHLVEIVNPNQLDYKYKNGALLISGRLGRMDDNQINSMVIRNVKEKLKKAA